MHGAGMPLPLHLHLCSSAVSRYGVTLSPVPICQSQQREMIIEQNPEIDNPTEEVCRLNAALPSMACLPMLCNGQMWGYAPDTGHSLPRQCLNTA